ncbi:DUF2878 domain-containing protein [Aurantivibrio plasticivorans]
MNQASWVVNVGNAVIFQVGWFLSLFFYDSSLVVLVALVMVLIANQLLSAFSRAEWFVVGVVSVAGCVMDQLLGLMGVFEFSGGVLIPLWLVSIWIMFATLLVRSLNWLVSKKSLSVILAFLFAPLSYFSGAKLTGVSFGLSAEISMLTVACCWALMLPAMLWITESFTSDRGCANA